MSVTPRLLVALAATLAVSLAGSASAKIRHVRAKSSEQAQPQPPAPLPRQIIPEKGVQPLTPELEQALKPKDSFKECEFCPEMVVIPKGSFVMGTPADEPYRLKGADPQHAVNIPEADRGGALQHHV
jgi:formylglycine-generating enzyme required for sulfatase activity